MAKKSVVLDPKAKKAAATETRKEIAALKKTIKDNLAIVTQADKNKKVNLKAVEDAYKNDTAEALKANKDVQKQLDKAEARLVELTDAA